jgi:hypothetical protein
MVVHTAWALLHIQQCSKCSRYHEHGRSHSHIKIRQSTTVTRNNSVTPTSRLAVNNCHEQQMRQVHSYTQVLLRIFHEKARPNAYCIYASQPTCPPTHNPIMTYAPACGCCSQRIAACSPTTDAYFPLSTTLQHKLLTAQPVLQDKLVCIYITTNTGSIHCFSSTTTCFDCQQTVILCTHRGCCRLPSAAGASAAGIIAVDCNAAAAAASVTSNLLSCPLLSLRLLQLPARHHCCCCC